MTLQEMVCAHCQQPLNWYRRGDTETWLHPRPDQPIDHEAVPIPRREATEVHLVCDFCTVDEVQWAYVAQEIAFTLATPTYTKEQERRRIAKGWEAVSPKPGLATDLSMSTASDTWMACEGCSALIELRDQERLITRLRRLKPDTFGRVTRTVLRDLYAEFFRHVGDRITAEEANRRHLTKEKSS